MPRCHAEDTFRGADLRIDRMVRPAVSMRDLFGRPPGADGAQILSLRLGQGAVLVRACAASIAGPSPAYVKAVRHCRSQDIID